MSSDAYDPRYLAGIRWFNQREFFEAHETWEEVWTECHGPQRRFYQGLIQVAVCLHHFRNQNTRGARKLYHSSVKYLEPYRPVFLGLDLERLLAELEQCCRDLIGNNDTFPTTRFDERSLPTIQMVVPTESKGEGTQSDRL